jgi:putative methyltransferase (TIGR04325 family)
MNLNKFARDACPPALWRLASQLKRRLVQSPPAGGAIRFSGDYASWEAAKQDSGGYAAPEILAKTRGALLRVKNGESAYERDSVTFDAIGYEFPLLAGLLRAAAANGGRLSVLDFGGSLGSSYFQCRSFLTVVRELRWSVIEQPAHVACGRSEFANDQLRFYANIEECLRVEKPNVLLLSSLIQYLPKPYEFLDDALRHGFDYVIIDRTAIIRDGRERLTVEHVPEWIYKASYPAWFLSRESFLAKFQPHYNLLAEFNALDTTQPEGGEADYKGFIFERKK